jgi:transcriptional regulator with XRE-family HTH domain
MPRLNKIAYQHALIDKGLTTAQIADKLGVARRTAYSWVNEGKMPRKQEHINELCRVLGKEPGELFTWG